MPQIPILIGGVLLKRLKYQCRSKALWQNAFLSSFAAHGPGLPSVHPVFFLIRKIKNKNSFESSCRLPRAPPLASVNAAARFLPSPASPPPSTSASELRSPSPSQISLLAKARDSRDPHNTRAAAIELTVAQTMDAQRRERRCRRHGATRQTARADEAVRASVRRLPVGRREDDARGLPNPNPRQ